MNAGLYIHIPFCMSKCPYCDFYSTKYNEQSAQDYTKRIIALMGNYSGEFDSVYFGGGTPSALDATVLMSILDEAKEHFNISDDAEITVECNPGKDLANDLKIYAKHGVNRISLGMQSAVDKERFALGRKAGKTEITRAITAARQANINNISLDLMLGTPKQTLESLDETFDFIKESNVQHISAYMLKIEEGTVFYNMKDRLDLPGEDTVCDMYLKTIGALKDMGLSQYEISNFSIPGFESRHNLKYWLLAPYLGLGATAHSFWNGKRFFYDKDLNLVSDGDGGSIEEQIMLGLRLNRGIDSQLIKKDINPYINMGLMQINDNRMSLTPKGMLVSNEIISELI